MHYLIVTLSCAVITRLAGAGIYYASAQYGYGIGLEYKLLLFYV